MPPDYTPADGKDVVELGDYIKTCRPDWVSPRFGETFVEFVAKHGKALRKRYGVAKVDQWQPVPAADLPPRRAGRRAATRG